MRDDTHPPPGDNFDVIWHDFVSIKIEVPFLYVSVGGFGGVSAVIVVI